MPELPEVETITRGLAKRVTGDVVESVWLGQKKETLKSPATEIAAALEQSRIAAVRRMGKHIVFDLEQPTVARATPAREKQEQKWQEEGRGAVRPVIFNRTGSRGRERQPHTAQGSVDRSPRHDRQPARVRAADGSREAHARHPQDCRPVANCVSSILAASAV